MCTSDSFGRSSKLRFRTTSTVLSGVRAPLVTNMTALYLPRRKVLTIKMNMLTEESTRVPMNTKWARIKMPLSCAPRLLRRRSSAITSI